MKTVKIFISSTFRDMNAERDVLIKNVFPRLREKAEEIGLFIREVDLRWGVTEEEAKRGEALEICLDGIEECRPYFLCMLGKRYGWIPAPNYIRVADFEEILLSTALSAEELQLLKESYHKTEDEVRVYSLDNSLPNETKDRLQMILENAGLPEAKDSITEKEINHAVLKSEIPRFIPKLDLILDKLPAERQLTPDEDSLLKKLYIRTTGEPVWHLLPGLTQDEKEQLTPILQKIDFKIEMHSFFYFRQDVGEDHNDFIETHPLPINKLIRLKQQICDSDKPVVKPKSLDDCYPCAWEKANIEDSVNHPIQQLAEFEERVFNDLWNHIQQNKELQVDEDKDKTELEKEMDHHFKFIDSRTYNFHGREALIDELTEKINLALEGKLLLDKQDYEGNPVKTQQIMVVGEPGSGKSALLAKLYQELNSQNLDKAGRLVIPLFVGASSKSTNPQYILTTFCQILIKEFGILEIVKDEKGQTIAEKPPSVPADLDELQDVFVKLLELVKEPGQELIINTKKESEETNTTVWESFISIPAKIIIILDAINQLQQEASAREMEWLPDNLPENTCIITSLIEDNNNQSTHKSQIEKKALSIIRQRFKNPYEIPISKLTEIEKEEIIEKYLALFNKKLPANLLKILTHKQEAFNPLFLNVALEELRIFSKHEELENFIENRIPETVIDMFEAVLDRIEEDIAVRFAEIDRNLFREFMINLAVGRNGLNEEDLRLLLGDWQKIKGIGKEGVQLTDFHWGELHRSMRSFLFSREERYDFFHQQLKQAVGNKYLSKSEEHFQAHKNIADFLELMGYDHLSTIQDLPHHLIKIQDWARTKDVLCDLLFVEAKISAKMLFELQNDYQSALDAIPKQVVNNQEQIKKYTEDLMAYAEGKIKKLEVIPSVSSFTNNSNQEDCTSNSQQTNYDLISAYSLFLKGEAHIFNSPYICPGIVIQQAYNSAKDGPVASSASQLIKTRNNLPLILSAPGTQPEYNPKPVLQRTIKVSGNKVTTSFDGQIGLIETSCSGLQVWDLQLGKCLKKISFSAGCDNLEITPNGTKFVLTTQDELQVWNIDSGVCIKKIKITPHIRCAKISPDARLSVCVCHDNTLRIWNLEAGNCIQTIEGNSGIINNIDITPDCRIAASGSKNGTISIWDLNGGSLQKTLEGHTDCVEAIALTPDGQTVVSASQDKVWVWDITSGQCTKQLDGNTRFIKALQITDDGKIVVFRSYDGIRVFQIENSQCLLSLSHTYLKEDFSLTPDGQFLTSINDFLQIWDLTAINPEKIDITQSAESCLSLSSDGETAISGVDNYLTNKNYPIKVWDMPTRKCVRQMEGHTGGIICLCISPDGKTCITGSRDNSFHFWQTTTGESFLKLEGYSNITSLDLSNEGRFLGTGNHEVIKVWDVQNGECYRTFKSGSWGDTFEKWGLDLGKSESSLSGHTDLITSLKITPDGKKLISGSRDKTILVWDIEAGFCEKQLKGHTSEITSIDISPNGKNIISGSYDATIRIWDINTGECLKVIEDAEWIDEIKITPNGMEILSLSDDHDIRLWDIETGKCVAYAYFKGDVISLSPIVMENRFICGTLDGQIRDVRLPNIKKAMPIATATRYWEFIQDSQSGRWDDKISVICPWCGKPSVVNTNEIGQIFKCSCSKDFQLNPFICDNLDLEFALKMDI